VIDIGYTHALKNRIQRNTHKKKNTWLLQIMRPAKNEFQLDLQQNSAQMLKHAHTLFSCGRIHAARGRLSFAHVLR
jgi:hypothetical protein